MTVLRRHCQTWKLPQALILVTHNIPWPLDSLRCPTEGMGLIGLRKLKRSKMSSGDIQLVSCRLASKSQIKNSGQRAENFWYSIPCLQARPHDVLAVQHLRKNASNAEHGYYWISLISNAFRVQVLFFGIFCYTGMYCRCYLWLYREP